MSTPDTLIVRRVDYTGDEVGYVYDHLYVELFWLPLLGPGSWALLRHLYLATGLEREVELDVEDTAEALGVAAARITNSMARLYKKRLAYPGLVGFDLPAFVRPLSRRDIGQLPPRLADRLEAWWTTY